jgi:hypothetical protein
MIKSILSHINGIEHYGILSMSLFVFVFAGMLIWVLRMKKSHLARMASAPLDRESEANPTEATHE